MVGAIFIKRLSMRAKAVVAIRKLHRCTRIDDVWRSDGVLIDLVQMGVHGHAGLIDNLVLKGIRSPCGGHTPMNDNGREKIAHNGVGTRPSKEEESEDCAQR